MSEKLPYSERIERKRLAKLDAEIQANMAPTDGWDQTPRPNEIDSEQSSVSSENGVELPLGHIALRGDSAK